MKSLEIKGQNLPDIGLGTLSWQNPQQLTNSGGGGGIRQRAAKNTYGCVRDLTTKPHVGARGIKGD